jgi:hypothetical protein
MQRRDLGKVLLASAAASALTARQATAQTCTPPCAEGDVRNFGVVGNGVADDTAALQAAANFCASTGTPILGFAGTCRVTNTINLACIGDLSALTVKADSSAVYSVVRLGTTAGAPTLLNGAIRLPKIINSAKTGLGWPAGGIGLELANLYQAEIYVPYVHGFLIGIFAGGYTSGFCYNTVNLGMISSNKIGLRIQGRTSAGWANQNTFIGGRFFIPSEEGSNILGARYIQLTPLDLGIVDNTWPNGNTFIGCTVESGEAEYLLEIAGSHNVFMNCRFEATPADVAILGHPTSNMTHENMIIGGYGSANLTLTQTGVTTNNGVLNPRASLGFTLGSGPKMLSGTGSPQGVVAAPVGSLYMRADGSGTLYVKQSGGSTNSGWVAK